MSAFAGYARYYDLLYSDKDYAGETAYMDSVLRRHRVAGRRLLDLGCGTGRHLEQLRRLGYTVEGVDLSADMVAVARRRLPDVTLHVGDLRLFRAGHAFDAVLACFHVINYQITPTDVEAAFRTARAHLEPGGLFLFDSWHGPAVRADPPGAREKRVQRDGVAIVRRARADHWPDHQRVDVHYRMDVHEGGAQREFEETHHIRYLFPTEVADACAAAGFELLESEAWLTGAPPDESTWGVCYVARAHGR